MRYFPALALAALGVLAATPVHADTLTEVVTHGIILTIGGMDIEVTYTPDHKFTVLDGQVTGEWRIDGTKLCTKSTVAPEESCAEYPKDKKSGDTFVLTSPEGEAKIKIR